MIEDQLRFLSPPNVSIGSNYFGSLMRKREADQIQPTTTVTFTKKHNFSDQLVAKIMEIVARKSYGVPIQIAKGPTNLVLLIPSNVNIADLARLFEAVDGLEVSATQQPAR